MEYIDLNKYGSVCSNQTYIFNDNVLKYMSYNDNLDNIDIDMAELDNNIYEYIFVRNKNIINKKRIYPDSSIFNFYEKEKAVIYNYNNSIIRDEDCFIIELKCNNKKFDLNFDKNKSAIVIKCSHYIYCKVFLNKDDGSVDFSKVQEKYILSDKGFLCKNYINNSFTYCNEDITIESNFLIRKPMITNCVLLDNCPTNIIFYKNEKEFKKFYLKYNKDGIISKCIDNDGNKLCRYESNNRTTISIHPHLFDPFNYDYNDYPLKYWCVDTVDKLDSGMVLNRKIFNIYNDIKFIEDLSNNINVPIIF